jgi:hypothetical protein
VGYSARAMRPSDGGNGGNYPKTDWRGTTLPVEARLACRTAPHMMMGDLMRQLLEQLFSPKPEISDAARQRLMHRGARTAEEARAVLEALSREPPSPRSALGGPHGMLLGLIQAPASEEAMEYFRDHAPRALIAAWPKLPEYERGFALKVLALIGEREGLEFVARTVGALDGPRDYMVSLALESVPADTEHADVLFPALSPMLDREDSRAISVLDLANRLVAAGRLKPHPAATRMERLRHYVEREDDNAHDAAIAACYAASLIPDAQSLELLELGSRHPDPMVRLEALYGKSRHGAPGAVEALAQATLEPAIAQRARKYLEELGKAHLIPKEADDPVLLAKAEMVSWLMHPNEFGEEPESIELWDRRVLDWPPTGDRRELFLFHYRYPAWGDEEPERGVGLVGSETFSLTNETKPPPEGTPEEAYVAHCLWELQQAGDPRAETLTPDGVRKLLGFGPRLVH